MNMTELLAYTVLATFITTLLTAFRVIYETHAEYKRQERLEKERAARIADLRRKVKFSEKGNLSWTT